MTLDATTNVKGEGTIENAQVNANDVKIESKPKNVEVANNVTVEIANEVVDSITNPIVPKEEDKD